MSIAYGSIVTRDIPYMYAVSADDLGAEDIFRFERVHHVEPKKFVLVKHTRECIVLNKNLKNLKEIEEIIEKLCEKFQSLNFLAFSSSFTTFPYRY